MFYIVNIPEMLLTGLTDCEQLIKCKQPNFQTTLKTEGTIIQYPNFDKSLLFGSQSVRLKMSMAL